jgi:hypothetical protein
LQKCIEAGRQIFQVQKIFTVPKSAFCLASFQASTAPRPENSDSDEKDALFGLDTQITIMSFANKNEF